MHINQKPTVKRWPQWIDVMGVATAAGWLLMAWTGYNGHPLITWFLALMAGMSIVWWRVYDSTQADESRALLWRVGVWAVIFRLIGLFCAPIYEDDHYRFLWDGHWFLSAGNPYDRAPSEFFQDPKVPESMQPVLSGINNPDIPTIYGPAAEMLFAIGALLAPGDLWPLRIMAILADVAILVVLARIGGVRAIVLYGWCPLVIKENAFTLHTDVFGALAMVFAIAALSCGRRVVAGVAIGVALAVKPLAIIALGLLVRGWKDFWLALTAVVVWLGFLMPFLWQGGGAGLDVTWRFASDWEFNSSLLPLLRWCIGETAARYALAIAAITGLFILWLWQRRRPVGEVRADMGYAWMFLCAAVVNPWYLVWMAPFVALYPSLWGRVVLLVAPLAYVTGGATGWEGLGRYDHPWWLRWLEYGSVAAVLAWIFWQKMPPANRSRWLKSNDINRS